MSTTAPTGFHHVIAFNCVPSNFPLPKRKTPIIPRVKIVLSNDFLQGSHPAFGGSKSGMEMAHDIFDALYNLGLQPIFADSDGFRVRCWMRQDDIERERKIRRVAAWKPKPEPSEPLPVIGEQLGLLPIA